MTGSKHFSKTAIVFLHGLFGAAEIRRFWPGGRYYRQLEPALANTGLPVFYPEVPSGKSLAIRAGVLARFLADLPFDRIHLIAHSMGGLDGRYLINRLDEGRRIGSLTTIATPHRGSTLVNWVEKTHGPIQWFARQYLYPGILELTPEACQAFNQETPDRPDVIYRSWAGSRAVSEMPWAHRGMARELQQASGDNDGQVAVSSATWGDFRGTLRADHLELVGWNLDLPNRSLQRPFDHIGFYRSLVSGLAALD